MGPRSSLLAKEEANRQGKRWAKPAGWRLNLPAHHLVQDKDLALHFPKSHPRPYMVVNTSWVRVGHRVWGIPAILNVQKGIKYLQGIFKVILQFIFINSIMLAPPPWHITHNSRGTEAGAGSHSSQSCRQLWATCPAGDQTWVPTLLTAEPFKQPCRVFNGQNDFQYTTCRLEYGLADTNL